MKIPLVLQDINNKILPKKILVTSPNFFIKSFNRFSIKIQDDYELDFINSTVSKVSEDKIFDTPYIYSVKSPDNIIKDREILPQDANFSYTIFLGKTEKILTLEIVSVLDTYSIEN